MLAPEKRGPPAGEAAGRRGVVELAEGRLRANGYPTLRNVRCEYHGGALTLRGCLPTYYLKQVALAAVAGLETVERVVDQIEVRAVTGGGRRG